ncbi:MAG TPA: hypothetical protein VKH65_01410 [Myxococcales bacterium]|nr:MAG: hypothetical protein E6J64_12440 [Deltaproteobacteria bacterium]HMC33027.1 hypothetical protein [Myxococcales bacterium]
MQLTELLYQRVKDLGAQGQIALRPGYVAVVSRAASLRSALVAALFPGPDDLRRLVDGEGPTRVGLGLVSGDGTPYRLLRELGGARQLQRFDAAGKKFSTLSQDNLEIESFLRVECGLPAADNYFSFFVLESNELPSSRARGVAGPEAVVDSAKAQALKQELEQTRRYEGVQDRLFKVQQRLHELGELGRSFREAQDQLNSIQAELARSPWTPEQMKDLTTRAGRAKDDQKRRDDALSELAYKRQRAIQTTPPPAESLWGSFWFVGGLLLGIGIDALAVWLRNPPIAFAGLVPFFAALVALLRWIQVDEADKEAATYLKDLKEREQAVHRLYNEEQALLKNAMKAAHVDSASDLVQLFEEREKVIRSREDARSQVEELRKHPDLARVPIETPLLEEEKRKLEAEVSAQGFARPIGEIEIDLRHAMGLGGSRRGGTLVAEPEVPQNLVDKAAELLNLSADEVWEAIGQRLSAYLSALTDKRIVSSTTDEKRHWVLSNADGRGGPYHGLPPELKDLAYAALRLALLERVAAYKRLPVLVDDAFSALEPAKRALIAKMLKGIAAQTQIIHRTPEEPPQGTADLVVQA